MVNTTSNQSKIVKDQISSMLIQPLEDTSIFLSAGPQMFQSSEPLRIPRLVSSGEVDYVAEGQKIPDTYTADFDEVVMLPTDRPSFKTITRVTRELIRSAQLGVSQVLQSRIVKDQANALDNAFLTGDGSKNGITGLFNLEGATTVDEAIDSPDGFLRGLAAAAANDVSPTHIFINSADFFKLIEVKDNSGRYIVEPDVSRMAGYKLFGLPVVSSKRVPEGKAAIVDMKELAVVRDVNADVTILNEKYADTDEIGIRVVSRWDMAPLHDEGVVILGGGGSSETTPGAGSDSGSTRPSPRPSLPDYPRVGGDA